MLYCYKKFISHSKVVFIVAKIKIKIFNYFLRAKENAAMACRDFKDFVKAKELYSESVDDYFASGSINTAVQTLEKAAKMFELILPESAAEV